MSATLLIFSCGLFVACGDDDDNYYTSSYDSEKSRKSKPSISVLTSATTTTDLVVDFKVKIGKEADYDTEVIMYYGTSETNLSNERRCVFQSVEGKSTVYQYYKGQVTGFSRGTRIYYKGVVNNSGGSDETKVQSAQIKR